jgi:uncharacterized protein YcbX
LEATKEFDMQMVGRVESLWRYPVKSMMGEELARAYLAVGGVYGDRRYGFLSSAAPADFPYFTARERHDLLLHRALYRHPERMARPCGGFALSDDAVEIETPAGERLAVDDPRVIELLRNGVRERHEVTLVRSEDALVDSRPISLFSLQTVRQIGEEVGAELDKRRFRANVYVDLASGGGFGEDEWVGRRLRLGRDVEVQVLKRNKRCKLITLDPETSDANPEVIKCVARDHEMRAGIYAGVLVEGLVSVGDDVRVVE